MSALQTVEAACGYLKRGLAVLPIPSSQKRPVLPGWQKLRLTEDDLPTYFTSSSNIGVLNGEASRGLVDVDLDALEAVAVAASFLPSTGMIFGRDNKPQSHWEYFAEPLPATRQFKDDNGHGETTMLVELRSTGTQTVWPPSLHPSAEVIRFDLEGEPAHVNGVALQKAVARVAACALVARHWPRQGSRHQAALATAGLLLRAGWSLEDASSFVTCAARVGRDDEWQQRRNDVESTAKRLRAGGAVTAGPTLAEIIGERTVAKLREWLDLPSTDGRQSEIEELTDMGNARRLVARHGGDLRYVGEWRKWYYWDGKRWAKDQTGEADRRAKLTVRNMYAECEAVGDDTVRKALGKHAIHSQAAERLKAMMHVAETEGEVVVLPEQFDADPYALTVLNGTLDLHTGELREHRRDDLITKLAPVAYEPAAECPIFMAFLDRIFSGSSDLIQFVQRAVGYSLTGNTGERVVFILHGTGANGKTTLLEVLRAVLGEYAMRTPTETLLAKHGNAIPNDVARLKGARFVTASESEEGKRLAEAFIKDVTGGDVISARFMRGEFFDFKPECKLWLATNHKPEIRGTDKGIWDRIRLIPFVVRIPESEQDKQLLERLGEELPGILRWAVEGCLAWQQDHLGTPAAVREATEGYRQDMDVLGRFLLECSELHPEGRVLGKQLYDAYRRWCEQNREYVVSQKVFSTRLAERGFEKRHVREGAAWFGLRLTAGVTDVTDGDGFAAMKTDEPLREEEYPECRHDPSHPSQASNDERDAEPAGARDPDVPPDVPPMRCNIGNDPAWTSGSEIVAAAPTLRDREANWLPTLARSQSRIRLKTANDLDGAEGVDGLDEIDRRWKAHDRKIHDLILGSR